MVRSKAIYGKQQLINVAFQIVKDEGVEALSARRIAKELNISVATTYNYVENIAEIQKEIVVLGFNILYRELFRNLGKYNEDEQGSSIKKDILTIAHTLFLFAMDYEKIYRLMFFEKSAQFRRDKEIKPFYNFVSQVIGRLEVEREMKYEIKDRQKMIDYVIYGMISDKLNGINDCTIEEFDKHMEVYISIMLQTVSSRKDK